ncbi:MAG: HAD-IIIA family hydrolase, partial [Nanoarchaeota archaeon]
MNIAAFVDRDGVITDLKTYNQEGDLAFLNRKEDILFFEDTADAIKLLNRNSIKTVMVTNTPQIAKGFITEQEAISINQEIVNRLKEKGAIIDAIYFCPHHPKGTIEKYTVSCSCRKPLPGMLLQASREMNIDLRNSYMIGDRISDIKAGDLAGCKTIGVRTGYGCNDGFHDAIPNEMVDNFYEAAKLIDKKKQSLKLFINSGGKGERLYPLTLDIPKPMISVKGKPLLHHLVNWAKKYNISEIVMMNGYKAEKVIEYFGSGEKFGIPIKHSNEPSPLGSGGPLKFAEKHTDNTFVYLSGDLICEVDLKKMIEFHRKNNADATIFLHKSSHPQDSDILKVDETGRVIKFISKHDDHTNAGDLGNAGLVIMEPRVLNLMDSDIFNFENDFYPKMLNRNFKVMGYVSDELILDVGTPERLKMIEESDFGKENIIQPPSKEVISKNFKEHIALMQQAETIFPNKIAQISEVLINAYKNNRKVLIAGNGGSAADAQHISGELVNKFYYDRRALSALALSTDTSVLTSWANDKNFDFVFERQIEAHGNPGDVFIAISTSGNSINLINAVKKAKEKNMITIGLLGKDGGKLKAICDYEIT